MSGSEVKRTLFHPELTILKVRSRPTPDIRQIKKTPQIAGIIDEHNDANGSAAV
jgi:hypothetical protein